MRSAAKAWPWAALTLAPAARAEAWGCFGRNSSAEEVVVGAALGLLFGIVPLLTELAIATRTVNWLLGIHCRAALLILAAVPWAPLLGNLREIVDNNQVWTLLFLVVTIGVLVVVVRRSLPSRWGEWLYLVMGGVACYQGAWHSQPHCSTTEEIIIGYVSFWLATLPFWWLGVWLSYRIRRRRNARRPFADDPGR